MIADGAEDEEKWLAAGAAAFKQNAFYMQRAIVRFALLFFCSYLGDYSICVKLRFINF